MNDWVASYLVKENFLLTALEFYQELKESGKDQRLLSKLFKHREYSDDETFTRKQRDTEVGLPPNLIASDDNSKLLQSQLQKKDEKINVLQYEIRIMKADVDKLKQQLSESYQKSQRIQKQRMTEQLQSSGGGGGVGGSANTTISSSASSTGLAELLSSNEFHRGRSLSMDVSSGLSISPSIDGLQVDGGGESQQEGDASNSQPINQQEKQTINFMIKRFLMDNDYKISAISFSDEVSETDMINMDEVWNEGESNDREQDLNLLFLYRYYFKGSDQSKQRMKDTKALRDALSSIEQKNKMIKTYEQSLLAQEKNIDALQNENSELRDRLTLLESGNPVPVSVPVKKVDLMPRLLPKDGTVIKQTKESPTESIREISVLQAKLKEYEDQDKSLISMIGQKLPSLVRAVKANKREEFMPILIATLTMHTDFEVRNKLSALLFNLIKVPDSTQREIIMDGCINLARQISPDKFENELLPQCWEQVENKHPERRILVADACGHLASYISPALRYSLLLSMISQLISDRVEDVRSSVASNLARLVQSFEDIAESASKYPQVEEMLLQLLYDRSYNVGRIAKDTLAPVVVKWANGFNLVFDKLFATLFKHMESIAAKKLERMEKDTDKLSILLETIKGLIPLLSNIALDTMPSELDVEVPGSQSNTKRDQFDYFWSKYDAVRDRPLIDKWPVIKWISDTGLDRIIAIAVSTDVDLKSVTELCNSLIFELCFKFGRRFTNKIVQPKFLSYLSQQDVSVLKQKQVFLNKEQQVTTYLLKERLLPTYIVGVIASCDSSVMADFVRELVVSVGLNEKGWSSEHIPILHNSLSLSCRVGGELMDHVLSVLWNLCVHPAKTVRQIVVNLFSVLMDALDSNTISTRLMKALVTMSTDPERNVRISAIQGLGRLALNISAQGDLDRLGLQFDNFFASPDYEIRYEALKIYSQIIPKVETYFRDQYILKKLVKVGSENNLKSDQSDRKRTALLLFDCYRALNGCVLTRDAVSKYIIGGLEMLERDCHLLNDSTHKTVNDMIRDMKRGLDPNYGNEPKPNNTTTDPNNRLKQIFTLGLGGK